MHSKCPNPNCSSSSFEIVVKAPQNSQYKVYFVQCSFCGTPFGVLEYFNSGVFLHELKDQVSNLESSLSNIEYKIRNIENILRQSR